MRSRITAQDELAVLSILHRAGTGMTLDDVAQSVMLDHPKLAAVLEALFYKGHVYKEAMKYHLQKPLTYFKESEEQ